MYSQLKILDPSVFSYLSKKGKDRYPFLRRYCDPKTIFIGKRRVRSYDGRSNEAEFGRLLQSYQIRRTKDEVGLSLPPFTRYAIEVPLTSRDRLSLAQIEDRIRAQVQARARELEREWLDKGIPQERIDEKIRQILGSEALRLTSPLQQELGKKKAQWSVVRVRELLQEGHKVLVFAYHIDVAKEAGRCYAPLSPGRVQVATGEVIGKARDRLVQEAEKGSYDIFVVTSAFREGLTLNSFDRGMSLQRFWVPAWESQAESRIHRWGQDKSVSWDYLVCSGTLDDHIGELVTWKERGQAQAHGSPEERVIRWLLQK
jgi:SNF2 family DNA or RNA helicase